MHKVIAYFTVFLWCVTAITFVLGFINTPVWFAATLPYFILSSTPSAYFVIHRAIKRSMGG